MDYRKPPHSPRFTATVIGVPSAMGAYVTENVTAEIIFAAAFAVVMVLTIFGAAIDAYPEWMQRSEAAHEAVSLGRHRRKRRHDGLPDAPNDPGVGPSKGGFD